MINFNSSTSFLGIWKPELLNSDIFQEIAANVKSGSVVCENFGKKYAYITVHANTNEIQSLSKSLELRNPRFYDFDTTTRFCKLTFAEFETKSTLLVAE